MGISNAVRACNAGNGPSRARPNPKPPRANTETKPPSALVNANAIQANSVTNSASTTIPNTLGPLPFST